MQPLVNKSNKRHLDAKDLETPRKKAKSQSAYIFSASYLPKEVLLLITSFCSLNDQARWMQVSFAMQELMATNLIYNSNQNQTIYNQLGKEWPKVISRSTINWAKRITCVAIAAYDTDLSYGQQIQKLAELVKLNLLPNYHCLYLQFEASLSLGKELAGLNQLFNNHEFSIFSNTKELIISYDVDNIDNADAISLHQEMLHLTSKLTVLKILKLNPIFSIEASYMSDCANSYLVYQKSLKGLIKKLYTEQKVETIYHPNGMLYNKGYDQLLEEPEELEWMEEEFGVALLETLALIN